MSSDDPELAPADQISREVPLDRENTLEMVRNDYEEPWKGVLRESVQNATDAWGRNKSEGAIPEDRDLRITIELDTESRRLIYRDNAGGMTEETLVNNLVGIDTPDDQKQKGKSAGSYGRGFHVIASCGAGDTYVETKHPSGHNCLTVNNSGRYSPPETPKKTQLTTTGTYILNTSVHQYDIDEKLGDWEAVEDVLLANFNFLLQKKDVSIEYVIDGVSHYPTPVDLVKFREQGELAYESELDEFTHAGEQYQVTDLVVVDADAIDEDPPWLGVAMLKGNEYLENPFMTVQHFQPYNISSLNKPADMFGWCNADDLCPELEDNAHTSFQQGTPSKTGIREVLVDVHNEHFKQEQSTEEREELRSDITDNINEMLVDYDEFNQFQSPGGAFESNIGSDDGQNDNEGSYSILTCHAGKRQYDIGEEVPLTIAVENPPDAKPAGYQIHDIEVSRVGEGIITEFSDFGLNLDIDETKEFDGFTFRPSKEGRYVFRAQASKNEDDEYRDSSNVYIRIGDVEEQVSTPSESDGSETDGTQETSVAIVEETVMSPDKPDEFKAALQPGESGGFEVIVNTNRPEWKEAEDLEEERRQEIQRRLGTVWGIESVLLHYNIKRLEEDLQDTSVGDSALVDRMRELILERESLRSEIEATFTQKHGMNYD